MPLARGVISTDIMPLARSIISTDIMPLARGIISNQKYFGPYKVTPEALYEFK